MIGCVPVNQARHCSSAVNLGDMATSLRLAPAVKTARGINGLEDEDVSHELIRFATGQRALHLLLLTPRHGGLAQLSGRIHDFERCAHERAKDEDRCSTVRYGGVRPLPALFNSDARRGCITRRNNVTPFR